MQAFNPSHIYVDPTVKDLPLTKRVLRYFSGVPHQLLDNVEDLKKPISMTEAKKRLLISRFKGEAIRSCQGRGDYVCCNYLTMSLISNCHMECTYCILQDYLKNNPIVTLYANVEEILASIENHISQHPDQLFRLGTGELSDSLALDSFTHFSEILVPFAARQKNLVIELKTKSDQVQNLLGLDHQNKTVVSWSVNPQKYIEQEELKCSTLNERLNAARRVADEGYPIAFNLDPLLHFPDWEDQYKELVNQLKDSFQSTEIAWVSIGSLRFTPGLKSIIKTRFPKSRILTGELIQSKDGKVRYFRDAREKMYSHVHKLIEKAYPTAPNFLCMETFKVWEKVYKEFPPTKQNLEAKLTQRFAL